MTLLNRPFKLSQKRNIQQFISVAIDYSMEKLDDSRCESTVSYIDNNQITSTDFKHKIGVLACIAVMKSEYFYISILYK